MTRRERLENKAERLRGWAAKRETAAAAVFKAGEVYHGDTAFNTQPGHIPERARLIAREDRAYESHKKAEGMESRAAGIERALDKSIFSDDPDALESLAARIAELEAERDTMKAGNAAFKKGGIVAVAEVCGVKMAEHAAHTMALCPWEHRPFPGYALTNIGSNIRRLQKRAEEIKRRNERTAKTEAAGGVLITEHADINWCQVQFSEKPDAAILDALRAAGYRWGAGAWHGTTSALPACVRELAAPPCIGCAGTGTKEDHETSERSACGACDGTRDAPTDDPQLCETPAADGSIAVGSVAP